MGWVYLPSYGSPVQGLYVQELLEWLGGQVYYFCLNLSQLLIKL